MSDRDDRNPGHVPPTTDDVLRAIIPYVNFGGDVAAADMCSEWADEYDADHDGVADDDEDVPTSPESTPPTKTSNPTKTTPTKTVDK